MGNLDGFNAMTVETAEPFGPIPEGVYRLTVTRADLRANRAQTGRAVELELTVLDAPHEGRKLWERWDYDGHDERAVKKGMGKLASLCRAVDLAEPGDTANLVGRQVVAKVGILPARDGFEAKNVLRAILEHESRSLTQDGPSVASDSDIPF